jgi:NADH-ubiquinone oxidoreductase chain 6
LYFYKLLSGIVYILYFALLGSAVIFINLRHPVGLGLTLILHTLLIRGATGLAAGNFWFSYVLFLVFLGGVLVLFIYITRLASNEKFILSWGSLGVAALVVGLLTLGVVFYLCPSPGVYRVRSDWQPKGLDAASLGRMVMKLYSDECFKITALLILYLLYALLVCANIVRKYSGSLRNFN